MATLMLEGGADIRHIQEILGHAQLSTTALYAQVSIRQLQDVHRRTHPAEAGLRLEADVVEIGRRPA
jgi:integrase/recombinase XerD